MCLRIQRQMRHKPYFKLLVSVLHRAREELGSLQGGFGLSRAAVSGWTDCPLLHKRPFLLLYNLHLSNFCTPTPLIWSRLKEPNAQAILSFPSPLKAKFCKGLEPFWKNSDEIQTPQTNGINNKGNITKGSSKPRCSHSGIQGRCNALRDLRNEWEL